MTTIQRLIGFAPLIAAIEDVAEYGGTLTFSHLWNTPEHDAAEMYVMTYAGDDGHTIDVSEAEVTLQYVMENLREQLPVVGVEVDSVDELFSTATDRDALRERLTQVYKSIYSISQRVAQMSLLDMKGDNSTLWWSVMGSLGGLMEAIQTDPLQFPPDWTPAATMPDMTQYDQHAQSEPLELIVKGYARTFARESGYDTVYYINPNRAVVPVAWRLASPVTEDDGKVDYSDYSDLPPEVK